MKHQLFFLLQLYLILTIKADQTKIEEDVTETSLDSTYTDKTNDTVIIIKQDAPVEPIPVKILL